METLPLSPDPDEARVQALLDWASEESRRVQELLAQIPPIDPAALDALLAADQPQLAALLYAPVLEDAP